MYVMYACIVYRVCVCVFFCFRICLVFEYHEGHSIFLVTLPLHFPFRIICWPSPSPSHLGPRDPWPPFLPTLALVPLVPQSPTLQYLIFVWMVPSSTMELCVCKKKFTVLESLGWVSTPSLFFFYVFLYLSFFIFFYFISKPNIVH